MVRNRGMWHFRLIRSRIPARENRSGTTHWHAESLAAGAITHLCLQKRGVCRHQQTPVPARTILLPGDKEEQSMPGSHVIAELIPVDLLTTVASLSPLIYCPVLVAEQGIPKFDSDILTQNQLGPKTTTTAKTPLEPRPGQHPFARRPTIPRERSPIGAFVCDTPLRGRACRDAPDGR